MVKKTQYEQGLDDGFISAANAALHYMSNADKQHVQNLAETLGVTHEDMIKVEGDDDIYFEEDIKSNSKYWFSKKDQ